MKKLLLLLNTLKYLKWQQIYYRLLRKFIKPTVTEFFQGSKPNRSDKWKHVTLYDEKIDYLSQASFLNHTKKLDLPADWNIELPSKLWVYNLHYFEDLLSDNAEEKRDLHLKLLNKWVDQNPVGYGNGWEAYPSSLRIVNILKALLGGLELDKKLFGSIFEQTSFLSNNLEKHLLGNHYFVNLKTLLFAGLIFENVGWIRIAEKGLISQIPEQILDDGANFELSPMYHSLMLVDMLDMLNLSKAYPNKISIQLSDLLVKYIPKMIKFMDAMAHPDGSLSFFNDSVNGISPTKEKIEIYAKKMGFEIEPPDPNKTQIIDNSNSGYICVKLAKNKLIFDASHVGPEYIPAHAHADTLSFELSLGEERVFVNSGISEYEMGRYRKNQRKTKSHNTVEINGNDSSQVWHSFRVGNRARIIERSYKIESNNRISLSGKHDGYKKSFGGCTHSRRINFEKNSLTVNDSIFGGFKKATAYFFFHPDLNIYLEQNTLKVKGSDFLMQSNLEGLSCKLSDSIFHPEFGMTEKNKTLSVDFTDKDLKICFTWMANQL